MCVFPKVLLTPLYYRDLDADVLLPDDQQYLLGVEPQQLVLQCWIPRQVSHRLPFDEVSIINEIKQKILSAKGSCKKNSSTDGLAIKRGWGGGGGEGGGLKEKKKFF